MSTQPKSKASLALTVGAIGVVFGDIGTSPLYAFREALAQSAAGGIDPSEIIGVLSLALWALILVVSVKYVLFLMRADNHGEGGVLSLMALAKRAMGGSKTILWLGAAGAALFYGDAIITPALSVLSAVEGLRTVPGFADAMTPDIILAITVGILIGLFAIQSHGTARVARLFGPVCVIWFVAIGTLGFVHVFDEPRVLLAFNPAYAVSFIATHGVAGLFVLGAVFLTVTGAEALTADMGHFGLAPIRAGWFLLAFPALVLNYLGQGAFALATLEAAMHADKPFENADWFFLMAPHALRASLVLLATLATIIASQAVITGAYSLTQQAIALELLPRMTICQTSEDHAGQIYVPLVNWLLLIGVLMLTEGFRTSTAMAAAYGIAVTGTMVITTCLAFIVVWKLWHWQTWKAVLLIAPMLALDLVFFGANILRVAEGGWVPLLVAAGVGMIILTWVRGRGLLFDSTHRDSVAMSDLAAALANRPPNRVEGTAVFLTSDTQAAPSALLHNLKHNHVLHAHNVILKVETGTRPRIPDDERLEMQRIDENFSCATLHYGYMESPDVPVDLVLGQKPGNTLGGISYFIGRNVVTAPKGEGMPFLQDMVFLFLQTNSSNPTAFFKIPSNRVVELGSQVRI